MLGGIELSEGEPDKLFLRLGARIFRNERLAVVTVVAMKKAARTPLRFPRSPQVHRTPRIMSSAILRNHPTRSVDRFSADTLWFIWRDATFAAARLVGGCVSTRAFWTAPAERSDDGAFPQRCILGHIERHLTREAEQSGVALRFPPHSKNAALQHAKR